MDVAITGSTGLIGSALMEHLLADGHRVMRVVRRTPTNSDEMQWDPAAGSIDAGALEGIEVVVNLAGESIAGKKWTPEQKRRILDSRVQGTALLAKTIADLDSKPRVLVNASAVGVYGNRGDEELTEASAPGTGFLSDVVKEWEAAADPAQTAGVRVVLPRTGIVLSPVGGVLKQMLLPFKLGIGGRIASGQQYMSWISLTDEIRALRYLIDTDTMSGPVNLTGPTPVTNAEYTKTLGEVLHRPTLLPTPLFPLKALYGGELVEELLVDGQRVLPKVLETAGFTFEHASLEAALRAELGRPA
ncbi:MAG: TIGR01777 family oxidoreductase [Acidimicrobiia bacterium]